MLAVHLDGKVCLVPTLFGNLLTRWYGGMMVPRHIGFYSIVNIVLSMP